MDCVKVLDNIVAYVQGEVSDEGLRREIAAHIQRCRRCGREEGEVRRTLEVIREAGEDFVPSNRVWMMLLDRIRVIKAGLEIGEGGGDEDASLFEIEEAPAPRLTARTITVPRRKRVKAFAISLAAVACVLVAAWFVWMFLTGFYVEYVGGGKVFLADASNKIPAESGGRFYVGDRIEARTVAGESAGFVYPNGSEIRLEDSAVLEFKTENSVRLERGALHAVIPADGIGFVVETDFGSAKVTGTEFRISVGKTESRLDVIRGEVEFSCGGKTRTVGAGYRTSACADAAPAEPSRSVDGPVVKARKLLREHKLKIILSVYDYARKIYVSPAENEQVELPPDADVFFKFRITNEEQFALRVTRGNKESWLRVSTSADESGNLRSLGTVGEYIKAEENPEPDSHNTVTLEPGQSYVFVYRVSPDRIELAPGGSVYVRGVYRDARKSGRPINIGMAEPKPDEGEQDKPSAQ